MRNREQPSTAVSYRQDHLRCTETETKSRKAVIIASRMCLSVTLSLF